MNLNKETPNTKSEKAAVRSLIEQSALDSPPTVVASASELERWISQEPKRKQSPHVPPLTHRAKSLVSKPPVGSISISKRTQINTYRKSNNSKSSHKKLENKIISVPMISILLNAQPNESKIHSRSLFTRKLKTRSHSLTYTKDQGKPIDIMHIKRTLDMIVKSELYKGKAKENATPKQRTVKLNTIPGIAKYSQVLQPKFLQYA
ncbi:hypothetical protein SteCoe_25427 [Stentor coeruleus]|uniref:Uncharacterized protein n=1 Tax=Stentor coeruleus TaxID=5963 RepID=A0A1R2BF93_9CILI|nr:hypothetical protein SteCoe_25427 [Stentor coeruleus]